MKLNRYTGFAALLIVLGGMMLTSKLGFHVGHVMGYLIPIVMLVLGYLGVKSGKPAIGLLLGGLGALMLLVKLSWLIGIVIAVALIMYGISLLRNQRRSY